MTVVILIGFTRIALGVHYLSDVLAGWMLGALWLVLTTVAFRRWREETGTPGGGPLPGDVPSRNVNDLRPVPEQHPPAMSHPWRGFGVLAIVWVLVSGVLFGLGKLITTDPSVLPLSWDHSVVTWMAGHRDPGLTQILGYIGAVGGTPMIVTGVLVVVPLAVAFTRSWQPALFVAVTMLGEISLFLTTVTVIDRDRPDATSLNPDLPPTAGYPSGHVAATLALYTATAILACSITRRWWRWVAVAVAVILPALVALQRLYAAVHYPSDILGSVLLALPWTFAAWWATKPRDRPHSPTIHEGQNASPSSHPGESPNRS